MNKSSKTLEANKNINCLPKQYQDKRRGMIDILYIENKEQILPEHEKVMLGVIGNNERSKFFSYRRWQDRQAFLLGKLLVATCLDKYGYNYKLLSKLSYTKFKRPFIEAAKFDFNISHSGQFVICAFSQNQVVGVDIEQMQPVELKDFHYVLNEFDKQQISNSENSTYSFFKIWSAKEAVLKAEGCGLADDVFNVKVKGHTASFNKTIYYLKEIDIHPFYSSCVASLSPIDFITIEGITIDNCFKIFK